MGDSLEVLAGTAADSEIYLNFRVYPGPAMNPDHPWWTKYGADSRYDEGPAWVKVRMDSSEDRFGRVIPGRFASYIHELQSGSDGTGTAGYDRILPDDFFMPGTTIESMVASQACRFLPLEVVVSFICCPRYSCEQQEVEGQEDAADADDGGDGDGGRSGPR